MFRREIQTNIDAVTTLDVVCFGELIWDLYEADAKAAEKESISRTFRRELGGASVNVAITLARLAAKAGVAGAVGADKLGNAFEAALGNEGVETGGIVRGAGSTSVAFVTLGASGEASFIPHRGADLRLTEDEVTTSMAKARYVLVSTSAMLPAAKPATLKFLAAADKAKAVVVTDLNVRAHLWSSVGADADAMREATNELVERSALVKASERDLNAIAGKRGMSWLDEHAKHASWILTRGENGAAAVGEHGQVTAPTKRVRCIDRSGAGDAFTAGVLAVLVKAGAKPGTAEWKDPKTWTRALEVGHLLGAKAVASLGATTSLTSLDDVKSRLAAQKKAG